MARPRRETERLLTCIVYCLISLIFGLEASVFGPTANLLAAQTHVTAEDLGPVLGCSGLLMIVGGMPSGWLMDNFKGNHVLVGSLVIQTLGFVLLPLCSNVALLAIVYGLISLTFTCVNTGVNVLVIRLFTDQITLETNSQATGAWLNIIGVLFGVGGLIVPQIVNLSAWMWPWPGGAINSYYVIAVLAGVTAVLTALLPHVDDPTSGNASQQQQAGAQQSSSDVGDDISSNLLAPLLEPRNAGGSSTLHGQVKQPQRQQKQKVPMVFFAALLVVVFSNIGLELGVGGWIFTYGADYAHMSPLQARQLTSLYWLVFTLARVPAIFLASCVHLSTILLVTMPLAIAGAAMPLILSGSVASNPMILTAAVVLIGCGIAAGFPCSLSYATEYVTLDGTLNGILSMVAGVGATIFPFIVPWLAKQSFFGNLGFQWLMIVTLVSAILQFGGLLCMMASSRSLQKKNLAVRDGVIAGAAEEGMPEA